MTTEDLRKRIVKERLDGKTYSHIAEDLGITAGEVIDALGAAYRQPAPDEDFPYRKAALSNAVEAWRDWFWTDGKPDAPAAATEILRFAERFLPWLRGERPDPAEETPTGIYVRYTVDGNTWVQHIEERFVPGHARERDNLLDAASEYLIALHGPGGKMEYELPYSAPPKTKDAAEGAEEQNIPHYTQVFSQFSQKDQDEDGGRKSFTGTGKLLVLCNCGKNTGWLDAYEEMDQAAAFLEEHHDRPVEIDLAKVTWHLGELAGYRINTDRREPYLEHSCGWERELSYADMDLTQIVLLTARNKHVCQKKDQGTESG